MFLAIPLDSAVSIKGTNRDGSEAIDDIAITLLGEALSVHDLAGFLVMGGTVISLLCLLPLFLIQAAPPGEE